MILSEKMVYTENFAGTVDLITGIEDFDTSNLKFDNDFHTYRLNGKLLPSVTSLLADDTYKNVDENILEYAKRKGTLVHNEIEMYFKTDLKGFTKEFYEFLYIYTNQSKLFKNKAIFDFKTYSVATPMNRFKCYEQIKMYAQAVKYLTGEEIEYYYLVHLPHNSKGKVYDLRKEFENGNSKR